MSVCVHKEYQKWEDRVGVSAEISELIDDQGS